MITQFRQGCCAPAQSCRPIDNAPSLDADTEGPARPDPLVATVGALPTVGLCPPTIRRSALRRPPRAVLKVDCAEFQHSHEIAKLIGSPPGYLGHRETHPLITQEALGQWYRDDLKLSIVLFDEIEKASDALWQLLLGILDKATLTLGDNRRVDLSQALIFMTSNLGGIEITELTAGGLGFIQPENRMADELDSKVDRTAREAARRKFSPEFLNRLDKIVVFRTLQPEQLEKVLDIELRRLQERVLGVTATGAATGKAGRPFVFRVTGEARRFLLQEGTDVRYGARHLKRAIERLVVYPLANLVATGQISTGDIVRVDRSPAGSAEGHLDFWKEGEGAIVPIPAVTAPPEEEIETAGHGLPVQLPAVAAAKTTPVVCQTPNPGPRDDS